MQILSDYWKAKHQGQILDKKMTETMNQVRERSVGHATWSCDVMGDVSVEP